MKKLLAFLLAHTFQRYPFNCEYRYFTNDDESIDWDRTGSHVVIDQWETPFEHSMGKYPYKVIKTNTILDSIRKNTITYCIRTDQYPLLWMYVYFWNKIREFINKQYDW